MPHKSIDMINKNFKRKDRYTFMSSKHKYTREELIQIIQDLNDTLGHVPTKKDVAGEIIGGCHSVFGKWVYALEAAGVKTPTEKTLTRRAHHKAKWKKRHKEMSRRRSAKLKEKRECTLSGK